MNSATITTDMTLKTLASVLVLAAVLWISSVQAVEIAPTDPNDQSPINEQFEPIGNNNQLTQTSMNKKTATCGHKKKGVLGWLTDFSRKPANFHYIDFIELFH